MISSRRVAAAAPSAALLVLGLLRAAAASPDAASLHQQAVALASRGDYQGASILYRRIVSLRPQDAEARKDWMWSLWYAGKYEETIKAASDVWARNPKNLDALNLLGQAQLAADRPKEAFATYRQSLKIDPRQALARRALARIHENARDFQRALEYLQGLLKDAPNDPTLYAQIARVQFASGAYEPSAASWRRALELQPKSPEYELALAKALYFGGHSEPALSLAGEIAAADPHDWAAVDFLAAVQTLKGRPEAVAALLERSLAACEPKDEGRLLRLAWIYSSLGKNDRLLATLNRALRLNPGNAAAVLAKARLEVETGRFKDAEALYERATELNPSAIGAWSGLAGVLFEDRRFDRAIKAIESARRLDPTDPYLLALQARILGPEKRALGKEMIASWIKWNKKAAMPILLYHGLAASPDDPALKSRGYVTAAAFAEQMRVLHDAGFTPVDAAGAAAFFRGKRGLPPKPVMITFDEARLSGLQLADPILEEYGLKATLFVGIAEVEAAQTGYASWEDLAFYKRNGRWDFQSAGDRTHTPVAVDAAGRTGSFLSNRRWLESEKRMETGAQWSKRVLADHESARRKLRRRLGTKPSAFAFPEGDYGQEADSNFPDAARLNIKLCRKLYAVCFQRGAHGIDAQSRDPAFATRLEPQPDWDAERFSQALVDENPHILARRVLASFHLQLKEYDEAIALCRKLLKFQPREPILYDQLARAQYYLDRYAEAAESWGRAMRLAPDNLSYRLNKGKSLYFAGQQAGGLAQIREVIGRDPHNWEAVDFFAGVSSVTGHVGQAFQILENSLKDVAPKDEIRLLKMADSYGTNGRSLESLAAIERVLAAEPANGQALLGKADLLSGLGKGKEAQGYYERVIKDDPGALEAWKGLANAFSISSQTVLAAQTIEQARRLDPTDPYLLLTQSLYVYDAGDHERADKLLKDWLAANEETTLPVILYHGLTPFEDDPLLASTIHVSTAVFESHMRALREAGYGPVTVADAAAWFRGRKRLPPKPILIAFDDSRLSSFKYADPILKKYDLKATMFAQLYNTDIGPLWYANWSETIKYSRTGRWDIQAHGDLAHTAIPVDRDGRIRLFLTNRRWLAEKGRLETVAEWTERVRSDHRSCKEKIRKHIGRAPVAFAFPEGDYGQEAAPNLPDSAKLNLQLCREEYAMCFHQDKYGVNVRSRDRALAVRMEPLPEWTGEELVRRLSDGNPFVLFRRELLIRAGWDRNIHEASQRLAEIQTGGASPVSLKADEARVRFYAGEEVQGLALAREAIQMNDNPENRRLLESLSDAARPQSLSNMHYYSDNRSRENFGIEQSFGPWALGNGSIRAVPQYEMYREQGIPAVSDYGGGVEIAQNLGLYQSLTAGLIGHDLSGRAKDETTAYGALRSQWTDAFSTQLEGGRSLYDTARALNDNVLVRHVGLSGQWDVPGSWKVSAQGRDSNLTDGNHRVAVATRVSRPFVTGGSLKLSYQFTYDNMNRINRDYYSPQHMRMHQAGPEYEAEVRRVFKTDVRYLLGVGDEQGARDEFVQELEAELRWDWTDRLSLSFAVSLTRMPTYHGNMYALAPSYRF